MAWRDIEKELRKKCDNERKPYDAVFELTPLCNFSCSMCYIHLSPAQLDGKQLLSKETWIGFAKQLKSMGAVEIILTGGEAMLHSDFWEIYEALIRMGFLVTLRSNGYLLIEEFAARLKKLPPHLIQITLYGASDETYAKVCGVKDGFSVVTPNIENLLAQKLPVRVTMTMIKDNESDMKALSEWTKERGLFLSSYWMLFNPFENTDRSNAELWAKPDEVEDSECDVELEEVIETPERVNSDWAFSTCKAPHAQVTFTWDGKMTPCTGVPYIWTDPINNSVEDAFLELGRKIDETKKPTECKDCKYINFCFTCPSFFIQPDGSSKVDAQCCRRARYRYKQAVLAEKEKKKNEAEI